MEYIIAAVLSLEVLGYFAWLRKLRIEAEQPPGATSVTSTLDSDHIGLV